MASEIIENITGLDEIMPKRSGNSKIVLDPDAIHIELDPIQKDTDIFDSAVIIDSDPNENIPRAAKVIAAMPAFNEEKYIAKTILGCKPYVDEVIVVNDGSSDATAMIATACGARVVYHDVNQGYGAAIRTCFETAKDMQAHAMVIIDSDGQHDPEEIKKVLHPVLYNQADVSIGSRFIEGQKAEKIPFYRTIGMKVLDVATNHGSGMNFTDTQSGFRAYSNNAINKIRIGNTGMSAGSEILLQVKDHGLKIEEVPISCRYDIEDTSTHNPVVHGFKVLSGIITEVEYKRPLFYIGVPGIILIGAGLVDAGYLLSSYNSGNSLPFGPTILMLLLFMLGLLAVLSALNLHAMSKLLSEFTK
jgi:dolichol-phosphate mannosyltransferase